MSYENLPQQDSLDTYPNIEMRELSFNIYVSPEERIDPETEKKFKENARKLLTILVSKIGQEKLKQLNLGFIVTSSKLAWYEKADYYNLKSRNRVCLNVRWDSRLGDVAEEGIQLINQYIEQISIGEDVNVKSFVSQHGSEDLESSPMGLADLERRKDEINKKAQAGEISDTQQVALLTGLIEQYIKSGTRRK